MTNDWHWTHCPACNGEGRRDEVTGGMMTSGSSAPVMRRRMCECCEGSGRLRIPRGYSLTPDITPTPVTTNFTTKEVPSV